MYGIEQIGSDVSEGSQTILGYFQWSFSWIRFGFQTLLFIPPPAIFDCDQYAIYQPSDLATCYLIHCLCKFVYFSYLFSWRFTHVLTSWNVVATCFIFIAICREMEIKFEGLLKAFDTKLKYLIGVSKGWFLITCSWCDVEML